MAYTTIDDPTIYFNTVLYTGDGNNGRTVTGVGFQPDWVWAKERSDSSSHKLSDSVRGATKEIESNNSGAEGTNSSGLQSFDSDGFTVGTSVAWNQSSQTMASWNWKAGGSASSNTDGDVTASVSANTTAGFSIVKFTSSSSSGAMTVGHGLGATPQVVIVKDIGASGNWQTYFEGIGTANQQYLKLNDADAVANYSGLWGAGMTNSVIGIGVGVAVDANESDIAYCFAEKKGYSKFGRYTGNGNADGAFIYLGFKPAWILLKYDAISNWIMFDNKRSPFNPVDDFFYANESDSEDTGSSTVKCDFLSNGFKIRGTANAVNGSSNEIVFMAFAEAPFVNSNGVPCNAR